MIASNQVAAPVDGVAHGRSRAAGTICTIVAALFLAFDTILKVLRLDAAVEGTTSIGIRPTPCSGLAASSWCVWCCISCPERQSSGLC